LLIATKAIVERGLGQGFITEKRLNFAITRRSVAKELAANGVSARKIAKATGFSDRTIRRDLGAADAADIAANAAPTTRELLSQSDQNDWRTPREFLDAAREVMGAASILCYSPTAKERHHARRTRSVAANPPNSLVRNRQRCCPCYLFRRSP
jgi:hypothetical protein